MAEVKTWRVTGYYRGTRFEEVVKAYTTKQAKRFAGFEAGLRGFELNDFVKHGKARIRRV